MAPASSEFVMVRLDRAILRNPMDGGTIPGE
jgi:hypothetical protein